MKITVGSTNPVKLKATQEAAAAVFGPHVSVMTTATVSGVPDQPMSDDDALAGARNRALAALGDGEYGIGLEGGLMNVGDGWFVTGWVAVAAKGGQVHCASTLRMPVLPEVMDLVNQGMELGEADDRVFNLRDSKQKEGYVGIISNGLLSRSDIFRDALIVAFGHERVVKKR